MSKLSDGDGVLAQEHQAALRPCEANAIQIFDEKLFRDRHVFLRSQESRQECSVDDQNKHDSTEHVLQMLTRGPTILPNSERDVLRKLEEFGVLIFDPVRI